MNSRQLAEIQAPKRRRKRSILMAALLLVAVIGGAILLTWPLQEPTYSGKPLSHWLARHNEFGPVSDDTENQDPEALAYRNALRQMGTNATPHLLRMLRARDTVWKSKLMDLLETYGPDDFSFSPAVEQNSRAVWGFWCLGELATSSIPALVDIYTNPPSADSKDSVDSILKGLYPASAATANRWVPQPLQPAWFSEAGEIQMQLGATSNAILAFSDAIKLDPTNDSIYLSRASAKIQLEDFAGALPDIAKAVALNNSNQYAFSLSGWCKSGMHDFEGAEADFTAAIGLNTNDFSAYDSRGLARANLWRLDDALADFNKAIEMETNVAANYSYRAYTELLQTEYELATQDVSKALELDSQDAFAYQLRGDIRNALRDHKGSYEDFAKAIQLSPKESSAYTGRGAASVSLGDFKSASADLEKALRLDPKNGIAYLIRGYLKAKRGGEDSDALADFELAATLEAQSPDTHAMLGLFQYRCGQWGPALKNCRKALAMGARDGRPDLLACIWLIRAQAGEEAEANRELETFLKSLPSTQTNEWEASVPRFFSGSLMESNFLALSTSNARRPSLVESQVCDSLYYAGMKRKIAGDKQGALELFQKCVETKDNNNIACWNAATEMRGVTNK